MHIDFIMFLVMGIVLVSDTTKLTRNSQLLRKRLDEGPHIWEGERESNFRKLGNGQVNLFIFVLSIALQQGFLLLFRIQVWVNSTYCSLLIKSRFKVTFTLGKGSHFFVLPHILPPCPWYSRMSMCQVPIAGNRSYVVNNDINSSISCSINWMGGLLWHC